MADPRRRAEPDLSVLGGDEAAAFRARLDLVRPDLVEALAAVYVDADVTALADALVADAVAAAAARPPALRRLDRRREVDPAWFLAQDVVGYVCYADRFAGDLRGVRDRLDHLAALGVRYLHLMPLLRPRDGENDGGYAVQDYDEVDPRLGTTADLEALAQVAHERGLALCVDLVLNHTAREHAWARAAAAGDPYYRAFYRIYPDRSEPDAYERTLPEVFPDTAPGSFSPLPTGEWVWTTFHDYQWDLDWANPEVLRAMLGVVHRLAARGVDVIRLDAAPFLWKQLGTSGQDLPQAHRLLQVVRAVARLAEPGVLLKAEAIVGPDQLVPYLGGHRLFRPECDLAYDNQLMVMLWSSLATRDVRLATHALRRRPPAPSGTGWVSYVRCHDDIGWAVADEDAWAVGLDPFAHRRFLADFYAGRHPGSFARGTDFQVNPATGDVRTSGTTAALAGLTAALAGPSGDGSDADPAEVDAAVRRVVLLHAVTYSFGGIPLVYMGDEVGLGDDEAWADVPEHAHDNRWRHRPVMDWGRVGADGVPARLLAALVALGRARASTEALRADAATTVLDSGNPHVLAYRRHHRRAEPLVVLACFSDDAQTVDAGLLAAAGVDRPRLVHGSTGTLELRDGRLHLPAWGHVWVTTEPPTG